MSLTIAGDGGVAAWDALAGKVDPETYALAGRERQVFRIYKSIPKLSFNRLDVAIKIAYLRSAHRSRFSERLYSEHLRAFSLGSFIEDGADDKDSLDKYKRDAFNILRIVQDGEFDPEKSLVPVGLDGSLINGGHRAAASILTNTPIWMVETGLPPRPYDYNFFFNRGMSGDLLAAAAINFMEMAGNCFLAVIWPSARRYRQQIQDRLSKVIYVRDVKFNHYGARALLGQIYAGHPWLGAAADNFRGMDLKHAACFNNPSPLTAIAFQCDEPADIQRLKSELRSICGIAENSVHISATPADAFGLARLLFNTSSVHFMNNARSVANPAKSGSLAQLDKILQATGLPKDALAIDGGMVMAAYGLREAQDFEVISSERTFSVTRTGELRDHGVQDEYFGILPGDIIDNPAYHFHSWNIRFVSLELVAQIKRRRGALADLADLKLIEPVLNQRIPWLTRHNLTARWRFYKARLRAFFGRKIGLILSDRFRDLIREIIARPAK